MSSKHGFLGSSPSSDGVGSANGTPETRLTPFSSAKSINDKTAFIFNPAAVATASTASIQASMSQHGVNPMDKDPFITTGVKSPLVVNSQGQPAALHVANQSMIAPPALSQIEPASPMNSYSPALTQSGSFSTDSGSITRALKVSGIYHRVEAAILQTSVEKICNHSTGSLDFFRTGGDVLVRLSDIVDAISIYNSLKANHPEWSVEFITPASFTEKVTPNSPFTSAHEGQVNLVASFPPSGGLDRAKLEIIILDLLSIDGIVYAYQKQLATEAGTIRLIAEYSDVKSAAHAVERLNGATIRGINISIAFHKPDLAVSPRHRGHPNTPTRGGLHQGELTGPMNRMSVSSPGVMNGHIIPPGYASVLSPTGRSFVPTTFTISPGITTLPVSYGYQFSPSSGNFLGFTPPTPQYNQSHQNTHFRASSPSHHGFIADMGAWDGACSPSQGAPRGVSSPRYNIKRHNSSRGANRSSYPNSPVGQHNVVDIDRIRAGLDVRTTIMLRNIPNKIDQALLKSIVDQTSRGLYDFMYLRIDFANNCNVGYAFINFEDPYHIIGFVTARAGQRWNRYSSDKIAEVSYATIQGKDCLVQKFRNSSVMLEHPTFRPKIFFTGNDPRAGEEEAFPSPDNASKMRRSVENAEHVGLFAPRAGQHYRDEQRRRRSRYDRGTRLAALEEYDYEEYYSAELDFQDPYTD